MFDRVYSLLWPFWMTFQFAFDDRQFLINFHRLSFSLINFQRRSKLLWLVRASSLFPASLQHSTNHLLNFFPLFQSPPSSSSPSPLPPSLISLHHFCTRVSYSEYACSQAPPPTFFSLVIFLFFLRWWEFSRGEKARQIPFSLKMSLKCLII